MYLEPPGLYVLEGDGETRTQTPTSREEPTMSDEESRRSFLKWFAAGTGATLGGLAAGCGSPNPSDARDTSHADTRRTDTGNGGDTRISDTRSDMGGGMDADSSDTWRTDAAGQTDGGAPDGGTCERTGDDVEGPFFESGAPERRRLAPNDEPGRRILVEGTVYGPDCTTPVPGAMLDVWHANDEGDYYDASDDYRLRGQLQTTDDGSYSIETIKPGRYRTAGGLRPAHIHFTISSPGHQPLTTQMYFAGDPQLSPTDPCGGCASDDPTLIVDFQSETRQGTELLVGQFDIVLAAR
jgi:catechol 1,2-dioxygenase